MKKILTSLAFLLLSCGISNAALFESGTKDAQPMVLYGKTSLGAIVPIKVNSGGTIDINGGGWTADGTYIYQTDLTDKVGIGTATPAGLLSVAGNGGITANGGINAPAGFDISSAGYPINYTIIGYGTGTVYSLTNSAAKVSFGTYSPEISIDRAGTYEIYAEGRIKYNAATFAAAQTATLYIYRANNAPMAIDRGTTTVQLRILTATTDSAGYFKTPPVIYTTLNSNDNIQLFGILSASTGAGTVDVSEAILYARRIR